MTTTTAGPDVMGPAEVSRHLGVTITRVNQIRKDDPQFPPATTLSIGNVYDADLIRAYELDRKEERKMSQEKRQQGVRRRRTRAVLVYKLTGNAAEAARDVGVDPGTVRKWIEQVRA